MFKKMSRAFSFNLPKFGSTPAIQKKDSLMKDIEEQLKKI